MTANAEETSAQAKVVSSATVQVSQNLQTVATGAEEMGASIKEIAKNATEAAKVATSAVNVAETTTATVSKLGDSSNEIGQVIKVITSIAQQTNLLALNATIEAARAGEAGKGFAVVANEVKELAKETAKATEDISRKIEAIQTDTKAAVEAIASISEVINQVNGISNTIATAVEEQNATTNEMARNVSEAAQGSGEITSNIAGVAQAAESTSRGASDTQKAAQQLVETSAELRRLVEQFKIDSGEQAQPAAAAATRAEQSMVAACWTAESRGIVALNETERESDLAMTRIRILVVDDSVVIRKLLCDTLSSDPDLEVVGSASDGRIALAKIAQLKPDLVTLDVEMPVMNGLETLRKFASCIRKLPVIMFSTLTERGAAATLDALSLGASDYATKPSNTGSPAVAIAAIRTELIPKIKALCGGAVARLTSFASASSAGAGRRPHPTGASKLSPSALPPAVPTRWPKSCREFPKTSPFPSSWCNTCRRFLPGCWPNAWPAARQLQLTKAAAGAMLSPGQAWIAPGNFHMTVARAGVNSRLDLNQDPPENSCRPAVDVLFRSVADVYGANVLAVVMTGMGSDGVLGAQHIREAGGEVIIQDEASSVVWGMPGLVHAVGTGRCCLSRSINWHTKSRAASCRAVAAGAISIEHLQLHFGDSSQMTTRNLCRSPLPRPAQAVDPVFPANPRPGLQGMRHFSARRKTLSAGGCLRTAHESNSTSAPRASIGIC